MPGMSDNVTLVQNVTSNSLDTATVVLFLAFFFVGVFLCLLGLKWKRQRGNALSAGITALILGGLILFVRSEGLRGVLTGLASLIAVAIAAYSMRQAETSIKQTEQIRQDTADQQKREYKIRLLDEVRRWGMDLFNAQVPRVSIPDKVALAGYGELGKKAQASYDKADRAIRESSVMAEGSYIREIVEKLFEPELGDIFHRIEVEIGTIGFLTSLDSGVPAKTSFIGGQKVNELLEEIQSGKKTIEALDTEHRTLLTARLGELFTKIADLKSALV